MVDSYEAPGAQVTTPLPQDVVLSTDVSAEGELVASALRARGFLVRDVSVGQLEACVAELTPRIVLIDLDDAGAREVAARVGKIDGLSKPLLLCLGEQGDSGVRAAFPRPVDINALLAEVSAMLGPSTQGPTFSTPPSSAEPSRETMPPSGADSDLPIPLDMTSRSDALDMKSILPGIEEQDEEDGLDGPRVLPARLSPELEGLLASAEQRVLAQGNPSSSLPPDEEVSLILGEEMLAGLDEPLELDDDDQGTGSGHVKTPGSSGNLGEDGEDDERAAGDPTTGPGDPSLGEPDPLDTGPPPPPTPREASDGGPPTTWSHRPRPTPPPVTIPGRGAATNVGPPHFASPSQLPIIRDVTSPMRRTIESAVAPVIEVAPRHETEPPPPEVYAEGGAIALLARAIATRTSGSVALGADGDTRRILLHDGDIVTAATTRDDETLVAFLVARGDLPRSLTGPLSRVPFSGRHAGAALIANGHLSQDDLWPVLRAHAEWILGRAACEPEGTCAIEDEPPGRLKLEPSVFGGATGAEVLVETLRRVVPTEVALARIGGARAKLVEGARIGLLGECALPTDEEANIRATAGRSVDEIVRGRDPEIVNVLYALVELEVLDAIAPAAPEAEAPKGGADPLDEEALRARVAARLALVMDGDYFELLGVSRVATSYEIRRAYVELRRSFEPGRMLTAQTADLHDDVRVIIEVLDEAYEILRDAHKRDRYRTAIEAGPPE